MNVKFVSKDIFIESIREYLIDVSVVLDIGCGIRPQNYLEPKVHICCDPHLEYLQNIGNTISYYRENSPNDFKPNEFSTIKKENQSEFVFINSDWEGAVKLFPEKSVDTVFLLDIIEHLDKNKGAQLIKDTEKLCKKQIVVFTPLGFVEQEHQSEEDAWGLSGAHLQKHLSGWLPEDFDDSWSIIVCQDFHEYDNNGVKYEIPKGAFWAVKNLSFGAIKENDRFTQLFELGKKEFKNKNWLNSESAFCESAKLNPTLPELYNYMGLVKWNLGKTDESVLAFQESYRLEPNNELYALNLAESLNYTGKRDKCIQLCKDHLRYSSNSSGIRNFLVNIDAHYDNSFTYPYKIENLGELRLLGEYPCSKIYTSEINGKQVLYKVITKNMLMDFDHVNQSYKNLFFIDNVNDLVNVYDYRLSENGEKFEVLMDYLYDYENLATLPENRRIDYIFKVLDIIKKMIKQGFIPFDCGIVNFMTNGSDVKMIDLDLVLSWKEMNYFYSIWFITRLEEMITWCNKAKPEIENTIAMFQRMNKEYFSQLNEDLKAEEFLKEGENIFETNKDFETTINLFNNAVKLRPNYAEAFNNLGAIFWELNNIPRALALLRAAIEIDPYNEIYFTNYSHILSSIGKEDYANKILEEFKNLKKQTDNNSCSIDAIDEENESSIELLQQEIINYSYPSNYSYDLFTLEPKGQLTIRKEYWEKYSPELLYLSKNVLSVGSSLGYMLLYHANSAEKCTGIEPDSKAIGIVERVKKIRNVNNIELVNTTFKNFNKTKKYDLIWMGNVFHYMYADYGWEVAEILAKLSSDRCVIEAPLEGEFLMAQSDLNPLWKNTQLMTQYTTERFIAEMEKYFTIKSINPAGTDPKNRVLVVLIRKHN